MRKFGLYTVSILALIGSLSFCVAQAELPVLALDPPTSVEKWMKSEKIGDSAKPLPASTLWIKGEPVDVMNARRIYVIEFWATWCGPCIRSIPHISEMQKKYQDKVQFIGVSTDEEKNHDKVKSFVAEQGDKMDYTVAWDKDWKIMEAYWSFQNCNNYCGFPADLVIDQKHRVVWVGHPMDMKDDLEKIVAGTYSLEDAIMIQVMRTRLMYRHHYNAEVQREDTKKLLEDLKKYSHIRFQIIDASIRFGTACVNDLLKKLVFLDQEVATDILMDIFSGVSIQRLPRIEKLRLNR